MKDIIRMNQLAGIITEGQARKMMEILNEVNQPYKVLSKKTEKSDYSDRMFDTYSLELNDEMYTTPDGLTFQIKTVGSVLINSGEELDLDNSYHDFHSIQNNISDENGNKLEFIPGYSYGGSYERTKSISKAKRWLDKNGAKLMSGKGYQHKST